jgi:TPR repeat protein
MPPERIVPPVVPSVRKLSAGLIAVTIALVLLAAGAAAAWLYRDDIMAMLSGSEIQPGGGDLSLREELKQFMATNPTAKALVQKADNMAAEGKGEGAIYLYRQAIDKGSMEAALALGKLYDPTEPANSNSTTTSVETASFWYAKAANVNIAEAQRRLGLLQVRNGPGSATFDMGVENLKKAGDQGDGAATDKLKELGQ